MHVPAPNARLRGILAPVLLLLLAAAGCSQKQTSPSALCDNEGIDLVAFSSDRGHQGQYDIYLFDANQGGYRLLRNLNSATASDSSPALTSDGQVIAFVSSRAAAGSDIYVYERLSCSLIATPGLNSSGNETDPAFTGDTKRLAFVRDTLGHRRIREVNGGSYSFLALPGLDSLAAPYDDWAPSPDGSGEKLAFVSNREGSPHIYLYSRAGGSVDSLLAMRGTGGSDLEPSLTPDAHYLAFASDRAGGRGGFDIYLYNLSTRSWVGLDAVNSARDERRPSLNATGSALAFQSDSSASGTSVVRFYQIISKALDTITRDDAAAHDIAPSIRFP